MLAENGVHTVAGAIPTPTPAPPQPSLTAPPAARRAPASAGAGAGRRPTVTHLFNGMPPLHHRGPGPAAACRPGGHGAVAVELIGDGVHLDPETVRMVFGLVGADNVALVTDSMAATGLPDGDYELGPLRSGGPQGGGRPAEQRRPRRRYGHTAGGGPEDHRGRRDPKMP